jgi:SHS2 domain-containing protein
MGSFRFLDEIALADCAVDVSARNLSDVFETAARALAEVTVDPATVPASTVRTVALEASSLDLLLFDWLSELIYLKDRDAEVYVRTDVQVSGGGPYRLLARLYGGRIVPERTGRRADAKGVALHQFILEPCEGGWHARFVVDL